MFKKTQFITQVIPAALLIGLLGSCACTDTRKPEVDREKNNQNEVAFVDANNEKDDVNIAIANVKGIGDNQVNGTVTFTKVDGGIKIVADLEGLSPGKHGFHVHEHGDCGEGGHSAGGHFNPTNQKHGGPDSAERHVGDFGNVEADSKGKAHYERIDTLITFEGENSIIGRSIIIHADPDDLVSQPTGNSGARIGCGIIEFSSAIR